MTRSPLDVKVLSWASPGTLIEYVNALKSLGPTKGLACVAYAVVETQVPGFHDASSGGTLQVTLSSRHVARFTWLAVPAVQASVPVLSKKTENWAVSPDFRLVRNADSNR